MRPRSNRRKGAIVYWDGHRHRVIEAIGQDVIKDLDEFTALPVDDTTGDPTEWTATVVEVGAGDSTAASAVSVSGGALLLTTAANDNDGINVQKNGESFKLHASNIVAIRAIVGPFDEELQDDFFLGLAITDTDILGGVTDRVGIETLDAATQLSAITEKDSVQTLTDMGDIAVATRYEVEIYFDGSSVYFYLDGALVATHTTNIPDDELLRKSIQFWTGEAVAHTAIVETFNVFQIGRN